MAIVQINITTDELLSLMSGDVTAAVAALRPLIVQLQTQVSTMSQSVQTDIDNLTQSINNAINNLQTAAQNIQNEIAQLQAANPGVNTSSLDQAVAALQAEVNNVSSIAPQPAPPAP